MMPDLFEYLEEVMRRGVRATDPDTSYQAAVRNLSGRHTDRRKALAALVAAGDAGLTDFELASRMGRQQTSAGKRRGELRDLGLVEDTKRRRAAPSGSAAIVWAVTPLGRRAAQSLDQEQDF
jgi:hypothetical protein